MKAINVIIATIGRLEEKRHASTFGNGSFTFEEEIELLRLIDLVEKFMK